MIDKKEAAEALQSIDQMQRRTMRAKGYDYASGFMILTGLVWAVGYGLTGLTEPKQWTLIWLPLAAINFIGSFVLAMRAAPKVTGDPAARVRPAAKILWMGAALSVFIIATYLLFQPRSMVPYLAFPALVMALVYVMVGAQGMSRFVWIGVGIFIVTALGLTFSPQAIAFWVAAGGGGGLILGGFWLRHI